MARRWGEAEARMMRGMAPEARWHVRAVPVPGGGAPVDWWVADGRLSSAPVEGAAELPGAYVAPGLVDAHVHLTFEPHRRLGLSGPELVAAQVDEHVRAGVLALRDVGSLPDASPVAGSATVLACGPALAAPGSPLEHLFPGVPAQRAADVAAERARTGAPWVKLILDVPDPTPLTPTLSYPPSVVAEIAAAAHEAGARLAVHVMGDNVGLALDAGADTIEHGTLASEDEVREMAARGVALVPTLSTVAGRYLEPMGADAILDRARAALPLAAELGVPLLAGTDEEPPGTVAAEVGWMVRYGVPPEVAVAGASSAARAFFGLPALEDGAPADLVTFAADPAADVGALASPVAVVARGLRVR